LIQFFFSKKQTGEAARVRREHGKLLDYGGASVAVVAPQSYSEAYNNNTRGKEHAAVLPLDKFLVTFSQPLKLAGILETKGEEVIQSWISKNADPSMIHKRTAVGRVYPIFTHEFVTRRGVPQNSRYELWLNTYSFTAANMKANVPRPMTMENVRVSLGLFHMSH
jgi:hypothetical protein